MITTGGTGITTRDSTYEALTALFDKRIDGFGELFRILSFQEIGAAAMLSRATAGIAGRCAIFMLPGSEHAVRLAMTRLILPSWDTSRGSWHDDPCQERRPHEDDEADEAPEEVFFLGKVFGRSSKGSFLEDFVSFVDLRVVYALGTRALRAVAL